MAGLINDQLISNLRNVAYRQLVTPITIRRATKVESAFGTDEVWTDIETTTCWFVPSYKARTERQVGFIGQEENAQVRLAWGTDIAPGDRCVIDGYEYLVQDTNAGATISLYLKVYVERVS